MIKKTFRAVAVAAILILYAVIAVLVVYVVSRSGAYPNGADTMFYVYRADLIYRSAVEGKGLYVLLDSMWYNGVQTLRYWSPVPVWIMAGCQALTGGDPYLGYLLLVGLLYFLSAAVWLFIGCTHGRPWIGAFLGALWFFMPNNLYMLFVEGVLIRSMAVVVLPLFVVHVYDYINEGKWSALPKMMVCFLILVMLHLGWAGMIAITTLIFFVFCLLFIRRCRGRCLHVLGAMVLCFIIPGIWVVPSLIGGITGLDSSQVMAMHFQSLRITIDPFFTGIEGVGRWTFGNTYAYFGLAAFALGVFGALFSPKTDRPGFCTAVAVCLMTTSSAYELLRVMPGSQYLWMIRFISIALAFLLVGFFFWRSLRWVYAVVLALLLVLDAVPAMALIYQPGTGISPIERYTAQQERYLIDRAKEVTVQRVALVDPYTSLRDGVYLTAGFGPDAVATSSGAGVQSAVTYKNVVQLNQASEDETYLYLFDRSLALGCDTVLLPTGEADRGWCDTGAMDAAAAALGYRLVEENGGCRLYHKDTPETFGVVSSYRAIGIGRSAPSISQYYPAMEETESINLDDYTYEQLSAYDTVYLAGFTYSDREHAEDMVLRLTETGTRVVILADGIPADEETGTQLFLGVGAYSITFSGGYPELETIDGNLFCDLFPDGYTKWRTVYLNGLDDVWGYLDEEGHRLDFYGTAHNENLVFIGLNLTYHYALTQDPAVGRLLSHALTMSPAELPRRTVVPISVEQEGDTITIVSDYDDVDTTLAFHDIFESDQPIWAQNNLTYVKAGTTVIRMRYPYLIPGIAVSALGLALTVLFLVVTWRRTHPDEQPVYAAAPVPAAVAAAPVQYQAPTAQPAQYEPPPQYPASPTAQYQTPPQYPAAQPVQPPVQLPVQAPAVKAKPAKAAKPGKKPKIPPMPPPSGPNAGSYFLAAPPPPGQDDPPK